MISDVLQMLIDAGRRDGGAARGPHMAKHPNARSEQLMSCNPTIGFSLPVVRSASKGSWLQGGKNEPVEHGPMPLLAPRHEEEERERCTLSRVSLSSSLPRHLDLRATSAAMADRQQGAHMGSDR